MGSAGILITPGEGPGCPLPAFGAQRGYQHCDTEVVFVSRSPGNSSGSLGVTWSLAIGGKELISPWVWEARNWVWVN